MAVTTIPTTLARIITFSAAIVDRKLTRAVTALTTPPPSRPMLAVNRPTAPTASPTAAAAPANAKRSRTTGPSGLARRRWNAPAMLFNVPTNALRPPPPAVRRAKISTTRVASCTSSGPNWVDTPDSSRPNAGTSSSRTCRISGARARFSPSRASPPATAPIRRAVSCMTGTAFWKYSRSRCAPSALPVNARIRAVAPSSDVINVWPAPNAARPTLNRPAATFPTIRPS